MSIAAQQLVAQWRTRAQQYDNLDGETGSCLRDRVAELGRCADELDALLRSLGAEDDSKVVAEYPNKAAVVPTVERPGNPSFESSSAPDGKSLVVAQEPAMPIFAHKPGCEFTLSKPVDLCSCGGRFFTPERAAGASPVQDRREQRPTEESQEKL